MVWECGIGDCGAVFDDVESAISHQIDSHERLECKVCGTVVPDGYPAIRHMFTEHNRVEYVRAYDATAEDVREREELLAEIDATIDHHRLTEFLSRDTARQR